MDELDREAFLKVADDARLDTAEGDGFADQRLDLGGKRRARQRQVDNPAGQRAAVVEFQDGRRVARHDAVVAAVFRQVEDLAVGKPGELGCELVALAGRCAHGHREAVVEQAGNLAFDAADMVEISHHALADIAGAGRQHGDAARRHVDHLAGKFAPIRQHVASQQMNFHTLKASPLFSGRPNRLSLRQRHFHTGRPGFRYDEPYGVWG